MTTRTQATTMTRPSRAEPDAVLRVMERAAAVSVDGLTGFESRALGYLQAGYPLHLRGPAGSGKTTLALRIAHRLRRPVLLLVGDAVLDAHQLPGGEAGRRADKAADCPTALDRALALACVEGRTLIYDAFNRAPAETNNVLLTVLEERLLMRPAAAQGETCAPVHPDFRAIFTSNPAAGADSRRAGDALTDRMITLDLDVVERETEIAIVAARSGLRPRDAACIVDIVRDFRASREYAQRPTLRASIMIASVAAAQTLRITAGDAGFVQLCLDVLGSKLKPDADGLPDARQRQLLTQLIDHFCAPAARGMGA